MKDQTNTAPPRTIYQVDDQQDQNQQPNQTQAKNDPDPNQTAFVSVDKEHPPIPVNQSESIPFTEVGVEQDLDPEVAEYMQRVEKDKLELDQPIVVHGQTVVEPPNWNGRPSVTLPVSRQTVLGGLQEKVEKSVRWLATWCVRMIRKFQGRVIYSDSNYEPKE